MLKKDGIYDAPSQLGWGKTIILGIQHIFAMFGATVLVPILTGLSVQVTLICAGVGTLLFHLITKRKVPAFLGSSFAFLAGYGAITAMSDGKFATMEISEKLQYAGGGIICAGAVYLLMAGLIKWIGIKKILRFIPPVVTGPIIVLIGLNLAGTAVSSASSNWFLAVIAILTVVICNIWGKKMIKIIPILMGILVPYAIALICTGLSSWVIPADAASGLAGFIRSCAIDFSGLAGEKLVGIPPFALPKFDLSAILVMVPISLATMMEHIGDVSAISATTGKNFTEDPGLHRTLLGDGIATMLAGAVGGPANTTYGENTSVLTLTKVYDPKVVRIAAIGAIILSLSPVFDGVVNSIPAAIVGGVSFILYGMISAVGVRNMVENRIDLTKSRNLLITAVILVSGLGFQQYPISFSIGSANFQFGGLACAAIFGILLNAILPLKEDDYDETQAPDTSITITERAAEEAAK
ncbi:MAG: uracil-xanthine permease [Ruminococcaceae bacterium]|nr:uracil-xanthine permease [Oscillospiraceae bacterium]